MLCVPHKARVFLYLKGSVGRMLRLLQCPSRVLLCLLQASGDHKGDGAKVSNNRQGVTVRVEPRALFQLRPCSGKRDETRRAGREARANFGIETPNTPRLFLHLDF